MINTKKIIPYLKIIRIDHWFKNILVIFGIVIACNFKDSFYLNFFNIINICIGFISTCLIASSNYIINEYLDRSYDKFHPEKNRRPGAKGSLKKVIVFTLYFIFLLTGLHLANKINSYFLLTQIFFLISGFTYNVKPFRFKDLRIVDIISESINSPIRLLLGWFLVFETTLPPISVILAFWTCGAFLMTVKRLAELNRLRAKKINVSKYRKSLAKYSNSLLIILSIFFSNLSSFFTAIFLFKHRIELLLSIPFLVLFFVFHLETGLKSSKLSMETEKIFKNPKLNIVMMLLIVITLISFFIKVDFLNYFINPFS
jgi:4-hydroxybenzoate polyprenyltransferase